jgi:hypothetical protein
MARGSKWLLVASIFGALLQGARSEETFDLATRTAIQGVITRQLEAFAHDDPKGAEAFAAPAIQNRFPEPAQFLNMVKRNYGALLNPKSTQFGEVTTSPHGPLQKVTIVASDGSVWTAIYSFQQVDGAWRITGCGLEKVEGQQDI